MTPKQHVARFFRLRDERDRTGTPEAESALWDAIVDSVSAATGKTAEEITATHTYSDLIKGFIKEYQDHIQIEE